MKILSVDVGIKNLSFCLFELLPVIESKHLTIIKWDNINLSEKTERKCIEVDKNGLCDKPAKFSKDGKCYCLKHSKKHNYLQPSSDLKQSYLNKQKIQNLIDIADKYKLTYEKPPKKSNILGIINEFINNNCYTVIAKTNATKVDLVTIGRNIQHKFDEILSEHLSSIDNIIIENQIGPIANKMKTIQGMISQYFIMISEHPIEIDFVNSTNKLKLGEFQSNTDYKERKQQSVSLVKKMVDSSWLDFFNEHNKKDDLADCYLQGIWYIQNKNK